MSLRYVTRKLECQSLTEKEDGGEGQKVQAEELPIFSQEPDEKEDSGSESDDEEEEENIEPSDMNSSARVLRLRRPEVRGDVGDVGFSKMEFVIAAPVAAPVSGLCDDNYSSEEELKEIINCERQRKKSGASSSGNGAAAKSDSTLKAGGDSSGTKSTPTSRSSTGSSIEIGDKILNLGSGGVGLQSAPAEKRKWSAMSGCDVCGGSDPERASSSGPCSCDEDDAFDSRSGADGCHRLLLSSSSTASPMATTPVQFCTSPPIDAHKPRQHSASPPAKLFHMSQNNSGIGSGSGFQRTADPSVVISRQNSYSGLGLHETDDGSGGYTEDISDEILPNAKRSHHHRHHPTSPNKRHRLTPRPQNIQRPCLDFEKMQQIKKRVVTSWRPQGTELSLFCW